MFGKLSSSYFYLIKSTFIINQIFFFFNWEFQHSLILGSKISVQFHGSTFVSTESALAEAGNSVLTASVSHRSAANFACKRGIRIVSLEFSGKHSLEIGPLSLNTNLQSLLKIHLSHRFTRPNFCVSVLCVYFVCLLYCALNIKQDGLYTLQVCILIIM